jgi:AraC-like DNA-binding protein
MGLMNYTWKNNKRDIDVKQYVYFISSYHYNWHEAMELIIVLQGEIEVSKGGKNYILEKDDMMIINSNVGHATLAREPNSIAMVIHLNPIYFSCYYSDYHLLEFTCISSTKTRNDEPFKQVRKIAGEMIEVIRGKTPSERIYFESLLHQLTATLVRYFPPKEISSMEMASNKKKTAVVNKIIQYIDKNYKNKISLEDLSKISGYHKSYISQIVKQQLGINYYEYLTRIRLREATYALVDLDEKISDIALSYGFSEVKSFNTAFRSSFGKTPSEYRKQLSMDKTAQSMLKEKKFLGEEEFKISINRKRDYNPLDVIQTKQEEKEKLNEEDYQALREIRKSLDDSLKMMAKIEEKIK